MRGAEAEGDSKVGVAGQEVIAQLLVFLYHHRRMQYLLALEVWVGQHQQRLVQMETTQFLTRLLLLAAEEVEAIVLMARAGGVAGVLVYIHLLLVVVRPSKEMMEAENLFLVLTEAEAEGDLVQWEETVCQVMAATVAMG